MRPCLQTFLLAVLSTVSFDQAGYAQQKPATPSREASPIETVVELLQSCPAWSAPGSDPKVIVAHLNPLACLSTPALRAGIEQFVARCTTDKRYDIANMSKPFILNRLLFALPDKEAADVQYFGGWERPLNDTSRDPMWPVSLGADNKLLLTGNYTGYSGHRYLAVQEFDYFLRKYGRRLMPDGLPNQQGGANGRQPFSSDTNRTSAAAASRRSP
jgi:hypothetical protein